MSKEIYDYTVVPTENADPRNYEISRFVPGRHPIDDVEFMLDLPETEIVMRQYGGSCVGHAYAMAKKISEYQKTRKWIDVDPYWLYGTRYDGDYKGKGMMIDQPAKTLYKQGAILTRDFNRTSYEMPAIMEDVKDFNEKHPELLEAAKDLKIEGYAYIDPRNEEEMKTALKAGMPVVVSINAWSGMGGSEGIVHCNTKSGSDVGRHAVCVVGWVTRKDRPYWIMINSWGVFQGYKGLVFWDSMRKIYEAVSITDTITPVKAKCERISFSPNSTGFIADGELKQFDVMPYIKKNRTYMPIRFIAEHLGASVEWNADTGVATIRSEEAVLTITHKSKIMTINGVDYKMDVQPEIVDGRMMAPIRYIAELLNCTVNWDPTNNMVYITAL